MRTEQADIWLEFAPAQVEGYFKQSRLAGYGYGYGYASLGTPFSIVSKTSVGVSASIGIFVAWAEVPDGR